MNNFEQLEVLRQKYLNKKHLLKQNPDILQKFEEKFVVTYTSDSTVIEGNTLSKNETYNLLVNGRTPANKELREIYEQINHRDAFSYSVRELKKGKPLSEDIVKNIHKMLMNNIIDESGVYRRCPITVGGSNYEFPYPEKLPHLLSSFFEELALKESVCGMPESNVSAFSLACWTHAEFVGIHPFRDGNGRTSRLMMNYILLENDYVPISIPVESKTDYCNALETYHCTKNIEPFECFIAQLEMKSLNELYELAISAERTM